MNVFPNKIDDVFVVPIVECSLSDLESRKERSAKNSVRKNENGDYTPESVDY